MGYTRPIRRGDTTAPPRYRQWSTARRAQAAASLISRCGAVPRGLPTSRSGVVITHVNVVDVATGTVRPEMSVRIDSNRIASVSPTHRSAAAPGARVIDAIGKYLVPGLWDAHFVRTAGPDLESGAWLDRAYEIAPREHPISYWCPRLRVNPVVLGRGRNSIAWLPTA